MSGHGHVTLFSDGSKARCGGPGFCVECNKEAARAWLHERERATSAAAERDRLRELMDDAEAVIVRQREERLALRALLAEVRVLVPEVYDLRDRIDAALRGDQ